MTHTKPCVERIAEYCPNPVPIPADPPLHNGGIACGCPAETALEEAENAVDMAIKFFGAEVSIGDVRRLILAVRHHDAEQLRAWADEWRGAFDRASAMRLADRIDPYTEG